MREKYFWSIADEGKQIQVLQSVSFFSSSPRFLLFEVTDGEMNLWPHVTGSLGELRDRAFEFMQCQVLAHQ